MLLIIINLLIGYFIGMISCIIQIMYIEKKENKKITQIFPSMTPLTPFEKRCAKEEGEEIFIPVQNKINDKIKNEIEKKIKR